jgi:hypothetical protein
MKRNTRKANENKISVPIASGLFFLAAATIRMIPVIISKTIFSRLLSEDFPVNYEIARTL